MRLPPIPASARGLASTFRAAGLTRESVRRFTEGPDDLRKPLRPTREAQFTDDPAAVLVRLFFCGEPVERDALTPELRDCPLLEPAGPGKVASPLHLRLVRDLYLFSDYLGSHPDAVMGAGETTAILYRAAMPQSRLGSALDLGCGAGTLALLLATACERVTGTDINARAVAMARLNASVNGIANARFLAGDMYDPVDRERFDRIVSQPPYYPDGAAGSGLTYLHGGVRGDELPMRVIEGLPNHLSSNGDAFVFTSWPEDRDLISLPGYDVLELYANRRELHSARQCLDVIRPGEGWSRRFQVASDCWGHAGPRRIEELFASGKLLRQPGAALLAARLRLCDHEDAFEEGDEVVVRFSQSSLVGCVAMDRQTWRALSAVDRGGSAGTAPFDASAIDTIRMALDRGWLRPEACSPPALLVS